MADKPTYEALEQRAARLEKEVRSHRETQEDLKYQKKWLESFIEYSSLAIVTFDARHLVVSCNRNFEDLFLYKNKDIVGINLDDLVAGPGSIEKARSYSLNILSGNPVHASGRRRRKDGAPVDVDIIGIPVIVDGTVIGGYAIYLDVTERVNAQAALEKSRENYLAVFNSANDAIFVHHLESGEILDVNDKMLEMFGYASRDEVVGRGVDIICSGEPSFRAEDAHYRITGAAAGRPQLFEWHTKKKSGEFFWVEVNLKKAVIGGEDRILAIVRDITERRETEQKIRESEERLQAIFQATPDPVVVYDANGYPQYLNPAFSKVFGWDLEELEGRHIPFVPSDQQKITAEKIQEIYLTRRPVRFQSRRLTKTGQIIDTIVSAAIIKGYNGNPMGMVVNLTDISEQKQLQAKLQQAQRMEAVGTLAGGIAHNFNNFLMGIQGRASLILMDKDPDHPDYKNLKGIEEYVSNAAGLTKQLLGFARGGKYEVKKTDLNDLIKSNTEMFASTKREIVVHETYREIPRVEVDRSQIEQMLMNLYVNAWQAMPEGGDLYVETDLLTVGEAREKSLPEGPGRYVRISVTDTGVGMDEEIRMRVFEPFFTTKEIGRGTGLGLASAYGIVKNHDGLINVYSEKGEGTTFNVYLPALDPEKNVSEAESVSAGVKGGEGTILLVDDEKMILEVGQELLESLEYSVMTASDGNEAVALYERNKTGIDLVILDMIMPGTGGGVTYDRLKAVNRDVKVLLSSGYSINGKAQEIMDRGCKGFIQKPFNLEELARKIKKTLSEA